MASERAHREEESQLSRLPRAQEFLKTGFNAEAASAARLRAVAQRAEAESRPKLAQAVRELAAEKDALAIFQLEASGQLREPDASLVAALAEEHYENEALYPRMAQEVDPETAAVFSNVVAKQTEHARKLESLVDQLSRSSGDLTS
jgi:rubrerythrin